MQICHFPFSIEHSKALQKKEKRQLALESDICRHLMGHTNLGDTLVEGKVAEGVDGLLEAGLSLLGLEELGKLTLGSLVEVGVGHGV